MTRSESGRVAVLARIAQGRTNTVPGRAAFEQTFVTQVDPHGVLSPEELAKRVKAAKSLYFTRLSHMRRKP